MIQANIHKRVLPTDSALQGVAAEWLHHALTGERLDDLARGAFAGLAAAIGADYVALAAPVAGRWTAETEWGTAKTLPVDLLAEALDRECACSGSSWCAAPLATREAEMEVLVAHLASQQPSPPAPLPKGEGSDRAAAPLPKGEGRDKVAIAALEQLMPVVCQAVAGVRQRESDRQRLRRLEAVLEIVGQWNQTREIEPLLTQMAEAATRLLEADRASIFLWDRPNRALVGRPALGLENNELRIPDDRGVVGQVIQTGQARRADAATEPEVIDRQVDAQSHYKTHTLLCVPLRGRSGELFGAFELVNKRSGVFTGDDETALAELAAHAAVALENARDRQELLSAHRQIAEEAAGKARLLGQSPAIEALRSIVQRVADTDLAVLILGENGTGKEVLAQSVHYQSRRRDRPFVALNCAAIPETLAESELFGHEKGAFTDAREARAGKFELAAGGTLFLDEIGELSLGNQAKLLRVLEEKLLVRVGGSTPIHSDARLLAATNQNLAELVREKKFREDLYFRLNVVTLELPPLRERGDDVLLLAEYFLDDFRRRARRKTSPLSAAAKKRLLEHPWPGNVRELRNLMERLAYLSTAPRIEAEELAFILSPRGPMASAAELNRPLAEATDRFQIDYIRRQINQCGGNVSLAADRLGMHRSNLYRKMRQLKMEVS